MGIKAYFMIKMEQKFTQDGYYVEALRELEAMPEVESVEPVSGVCDLLVKVDAAVRMIFVANKLLGKEWVKSLHVLKIEPAEPTMTPKAVTRELLKAGGTSPK